jgi:D-beta-D-heptose 7-phosphate kinase/D-beta-D-heptose 1-phosphate adenosyltransferase
MVVNDIVLIGDISLDQFYKGDVLHIARDAPIPIVNVTNTEKIHGSSGIAIGALSKFGKKPIPIGIVGDDHAGKWIISSFQKMKIPISGIIIDKKTKTTTISRVIANSVQVSRFDEISHSELDKKNKQKLFEMIERQFKQSSLAVICDYGFGLFTNDIIGKIIEEAKKRKVDLFVSSTGTNYLKYRNSNAIIKINTADSLFLIKKHSELHSPQHILDSLSNILQIDRILLTRSHDGIAVYEHGVVTEMPATQDKVIDVKGIGEIMIAAVSYALLSKGNFVEACKLGNIAAGVAASKGRIDSISKSEIMKAKKEYDEWLGQK